MGKIKKAFLNMSITVSFMILMLSFAAIATLLSFATLEYSQNLSYNIKISYLQSGVIPYTEAIDDSGQSIREYDTKNLKDYFTVNDKFLYILYQALPFVLIPIFCICSLVGVPLLFYIIKLKKPMELIISGADKISKNNLDFEIQYDTKDEMGKLCQAYEKMRASLEINNHKLWRAMEERKKLNAAFSHDLRTPLTVLRGHTDFLEKYIPEGRVSMNKIHSIVRIMNNHILRLESFVENMNTIQRLEEIDISLKFISFDDFSSQLQETAKILGKDKQVAFSINTNLSNINVDLDVILQVYENLLSNAVRYSKHNITIACETKGNILKIIITDDGVGFSKEALQDATNPFFRDQHEPDKDHAGLGLNICSIICKKHGGNLILKNDPNAGAQVTATFKIYNTI